MHLLLTEIVLNNLKKHNFVDIAVSLLYAPPNAFVIWVSMMCSASLARENTYDKMLYVALVQIPLTGIALGNPSSQCPSPYPSGLEPKFVLKQHYFE